MAEVLADGGRQVLKAKILATKIISHTEPDFVQLRIVDDLSGNIICDTKILLEQFATMLFSSPASCEVTRWPNAPIGLVRQSKTEFVPFSVTRKYKDREKVKRFLKPFETDGWEGYPDDLFNENRLTEQDGKRGYMVTFSRHVDATEKGG
jgi:hypothetical protein